MAAPFKKNKLAEVRAKNENKLAQLTDRNTKPFDGAIEAVKDNALLKPYSTGNATRDLVGIEHQLNHLPEHLNNLNERQLGESWEHAEKIGKAAAWIKGHIVSIMKKNYGAENIKKFAAKHNLNQSTIYNYIQLAEIFPKVDPLLDPSFHFKAIAITHGNKEKSIEAIETARTKKESDPKYSVRDFVNDIGRKIKTGKSGKTNVAAGSSLKRVTSLLLGINKNGGLVKHKKELQEIKKIVDGILSRI